MLSKKKLYLCAVVFGLLLIMIATHTAQKANVLPVPVSPASAHTPRPTSAPDTGKPCLCPSCDSKPRHSPWFNRKFDEKQEPFIRNESSTISPLALRWWLALQRSPDGLRVSDVIKKMFQVISAAKKDPSLRAARCRCAVVGNSGNLRGSGYGPLINSHTVVIRMNKAITSGFEEDVGNRTTHHFMYPESAVDLTPGVHLVLLPFKLRDMQWVASALSTGNITTTYMRVKERVKADKDKVIVVNPTFFKYVHDTWMERHGRYPSTGMLAIFFALHTCDEVSVFGYGADQQGNWHHYWENNRYAGAFRKTGVHNADVETKIIEILDREGIIKLRRR